MHVWGGRGGEGGGVGGRSLYYLVRKCFIYCHLGFNNKEGTYHNNEFDQCVKNIITFKKKLEKNSKTSGFLFIYK
jgi:hypothetical protein